MRSPVSGEDTIVALATPPGRGALAIVRLSGQDAHQVAERVLGRSLGPDRQATRVNVRDDEGNLVDDAIAIRYVEPRSYTGEHAVEIICHGGLVTPARVVAQLVKAGARAALPGEFTRRAVLNGKLDLLQAEAVNDLITAESSGAAQLALQQLNGDLSRRIGDLRTRLLDLEALVVYEIDFPEEDDGPVPEEQITAATDALVQSLDALVGTIPVGELVREGALVVITGVPNVGKSSLFNALIGRQRAIVTETPGTTRDALEAVLNTSPFPLRIVDTAGIRDSADTVEQLGMGVSREYMSRADVILACGDSPESLAQAAGAATAASHAPVVRVRTKADLMPGSSGLATGHADVAVSSSTGRGLEVLIERVEGTLRDDHGSPALDAPVVAHVRYRTALELARDEVTRFRTAREAGGIPTAVSAVHLREAGRALEEILGVIDVEEILTRVFARFCVGK